MSFLLIDKPAGITSHDVVDRVRRMTGEKRVGHAGTLDPFATGLLIIGVGRESTKELSKFLNMDKEYLAEITLGATTETLDTESPAIDCSTKDGQIISLSEAQIKNAIKQLTGPQLQKPPMHSAIKKNGKKLYELARAGQVIEVPPRPVTVYSFELITDWPEAAITKPLPLSLKTRITCSSGTYIRALARDLGLLLETGGYLTGLRRSKIGDYKVEDALPCP